MHTNSRIDRVRGNIELHRRESRQERDRQSQRELSHRSTDTAPSTNCSIKNEEIPQGIGMQAPRCCSVGRKFNVYIATNVTCYCCKLIKNH